MTDKKVQSVDSSRSTGAELASGPSRRMVLLGVGAVVAAWPAHAQAPLGFSSIQVDVSYLRARGLGPFAEFVGAAMTDELRRVFADRIVRGGPRLVVRLTEFTLTAFPGPDGGDRRWRGGGGGSDAINGEALVVGPRGEILARHPQLAVLDAHASVADPYNEQRRAVAVAQHWARWLRRRI